MIWRSWTRTDWFRHSNLEFWSLSPPPPPPSVQSPLIVIVHIACKVASSAPVLLFCIPQELYMCIYNTCTSAYHIITLRPLSQSQDGSELPRIFFPPNTRRMHSRFFTPPIYSTQVQYRYQEHPECPPRKKRKKQSYVHYLEPILYA